MDDRHYNDQAFEQIRPACLYSKPSPGESDSPSPSESLEDSSPWKDLIVRRHVKARANGSTPEDQMIIDPDTAFHIFRQPETSTGLPRDVRGECWYVWSGAEAKSDTSDTSYVEYCCSSTAYDTRGENEEEEARQDIEKDLYRTFPQCRLFRPPPSSADAPEPLHIRKLRNVLQAYSVRNPEVGYCQGMNFLAALLLIYLEEQEAFWTLCCLIEDIFPRYYTKCMAGIHTDQRLLVDLVQQTCPRVYRHLQHLSLVHLQFMPLTFKWFLCLFCNSVELEVCLVQWDLIFFSRHRNVVFGLALGLLQSQEREILALEDPVELYSILRFVTFKSPEELVQLASSMTQKAAYRLVPISGLRQRHEGEVELEITAANVRRTQNVVSKDERKLCTAGDFLEYDFMDDIYAELLHSGSQRQFESTYQSVAEMSTNGTSSAGTEDSKEGSKSTGFDSWIKTFTGQHE